MPNGCHNRAPYKKSFIAQNGHHIVAGAILQPVYTNIEFKMSENCNYTHTKLGQEDKNCHGCKWRHTPSHTTEQQG